MDRNFIFLTGCERSGTTPLALLLNRHPEIVLGVERFKGYIKQERIAEFRPDLFDEQRFFDFRPGDTNATPDNRAELRGHYARARSKYAAATVVGDKIPSLLANLAAMRAAFPDARMLVIVRDVSGVANSWKRLGLIGKSKFFTGKTARHGVKAWNNAVNGAAQALDSKTPTFIVRYEEVFADEYDFRPMMDFIGVSLPPEFTESHLRSLQKAKRLAEREFDLDDEDRAFIAENADFELFQMITAQAR